MSVGAVWVGLCLVALPGCLINIGGTKTIDASANRVAVTFESDRGMDAFVQHVNLHYPAERKMGSGYFGIPFIISVNEQHVLSENAYFNSVVTKVDLDQDLRITDAELAAARIFMPPTEEM